MSVIINLLPWREVRRERRTRHIQLLLVSMLILGIGLGFGVARYYQSAFEAQEARNQYILQQTEQLDKDISDVRRYEEQVAQINEQLDLFRTLQNERLQTVRLFNAVAQSVVPGVVYQYLGRDRKAVSVTARAGTDRQVSEQLRRIALAPALGVPVLSEVENAAGDDAVGRQFRFVVEQHGGAARTESSAEGKADDV
jgi:type IV pilus assembly protein PilN